jgi:pimeloyl-ACP methyl ester carboxylesterase
MSQLQTIILGICLLYNAITMSAQQNNSLQSFGELEYPWPTHALEIESGQSIQYVEWGSDKERVLLFIHGLSSYLPAWKYNVPAFTEDYHVIALDLPGFGKSFFPENPTSLQDFAKYLAVFLEKKGLSKVTLIGHSMGGQIAMVLALESPQLVEKLVLVAPAGFEAFEEGDRAALLGATAPAVLEAAGEAQLAFNYKYNFYEWPERAEFMLQDRLAIRTAKEFSAYCQQVHWAVKAMLEGPVLHRLKDLNGPVLVVFGRQDQLIPNRFLHPQLDTESLVTEAVKQIPGAQLHFIDKAGHFVMFEQFEEFNQRLQAFLR